MNFWQTLKKPFFVLAPMDDVTDVVFRQIVAETARPDVFVTEFTNVEGLHSKGADKLLPRFEFTSDQHPIVAQIWGMEPDNYFKTAQMLEQMGFDGIDINMGCPERKVVKRGECSGLINNPQLAKSIIEATKKGAPELPISVKTRCGISTWETEEWIGFLLKQNLAAITVHGRIAKEMSKYPARWDEIAKAVTLRDQIAPQTLIIGNGDVVDYRDGLAKAQQSGVDGVMIGRGILKNIDAFSPLDAGAQAGQSGDHHARMLNLLLRHAQLFDQTWGQSKNFAILKKFCKLYINNFDGANELRSKLVSTNSLSELEALIKLNGGS